MPHFDLTSVLDAPYRAIKTVALERFRPSRLTQSHHSEAIAANTAHTDAELSSCHPQILAGKPLVGGQVWRASTLFSLFSPLRARASPLEVHLACSSSPRATVLLRRPPALRSNRRASRNRRRIRWPALAPRRSHRRVLQLALALPLPLPLPLPRPPLRPRPRPL